MNKEGLKKVIGWFVVSPFILFSMYSVYYCIVNDRLQYETDCGIVKSKSSDEVAIKHGTTTELYLNIQFDNSGFLSKNVSPTTYFSYSVGDRACFGIKKNKSGAHYFTCIVGYVVSYLLLCAILMGFIYFIGWLFEWWD